jgi:predicted enzyme related to lactoylglutathione lyase
MNTTSTAVMMLSVEVITLPVSDVERALRFYVDQVGFTLDVDYGGTTRTSSAGESMIRKRSTPTITR